MAMIQSGVTSDLLTVEPTFKAARTTIRPSEGVGFYQLGTSTGNLTNTTVLGTNAPLFSMRWAPANGKLAVIRRVTAGFVQTVGWTTGAAQQFNLFVARGWTVSDSGGTAITIAANTNKMRTTNDPSLFATPSDVRVATTATFTAGTRTLDTNPIATTVFAASQVAASSAVYPQQYNIIHDVNSGDHPIVLDNNEGIVFTNVTTWPAAANAQMFFNVEWYETTAY
jgi:hypothetical protein